MSNRLESLSGKRPGSGGAAGDAAGSSTGSATGSAAGSAASGAARPAKTSLRFKPKANVARRSQEDRAVKQEPVADHAALATRGRGGARGRGAGRGGARGGRQYAGTHIVSSGPLASGSVSIGGGVNGSKTGLTQDRVYNSQSPTPEFMQNLKLKELSLGGGGGHSGGGSAGGGSSATPDAFSDDEFDPTRININEEYRFADEETELFPVRPGRDAPRDEGKRPAAAEAAEESATASGSPTPLEGTLSEQLEAVRRRKHELEAKIAEPSNTLDLEEEAKYRGDFGSMARVLRGEGYTVMHLPKVLPRYEASAEAEATAAAAAKEEAAEAAEAAVAAEGAAAEEVASPEAKASAAESTSPTIKTEEPPLPGMDARAAAALSAGPYALAGQIGHVNIHRSGRVTINLGNDNVLEVAKGTAVDFLQEVVVLEGGEVARATRLGGVDEKMIATPLL